MFLRKSLFLSLTFGLVFNSSLSWAQPVQKIKNLKKPIRKAASLGEKYEAVSIVYESTNKAKLPLSEVKLNFGLFGNFISFKSPSNKEIVMDCHVSEDYTKWNCLSACEGGSLSISFNEDLKFNLIRISAFVIKDRSCDGSESANDRIIRSSKALTFKINGVSLKQD